MFVLSSSGRPLLKRLLSPALLILAALMLCACGQTPAPAPTPAQIVTSSPIPEAETPPPLPPVEIDGVLFSAETPRLVLTGLAVDKNELESLLPQFLDLSSLDLRGTSVAPDEAMALAERYPGIQIFWDVSLFDRIFSSDAAEIDLSGIEMEDSSEVEDSLK